MDANCVCKFNEYFEEEIVNEKGLQCSYFNFSGEDSSWFNKSIFFLNLSNFSSNILFPIGDLWQLN